MKTYKGRFKPKNPKKYDGDPTQIIYRSSWELRYMMKLDNDDDVVSWGSETIVVPYRSPVDRHIHRYYVDFVVTRINSKGKRETELIEIKPASQTVPPKKRGRQTKKYLTEVMTYGVNEAKWEAATSYCKAQGWKFIVLTEKELGITF